MQITLERLPPLISHFTFMIIGMVLSYILSPEKTSEEFFLPDKVLVSFPNKLWSQKKTQAPPLGSKVHFLKKTEEKSHCLFNNLVGVILQTEPYIVAAFSIKTANSLHQILNRKNNGLLSIATASVAADYRPCPEVQIKYGYAH